MNEGQSTSDKWFIPVVFCIGGILSVVNALRMPSAYFIALAILQFSLFFVLLMFRDPRLKGIIVGVNLCVAVGGIFAHSWHHYTQHQTNGSAVRTLILGALFMGTILGVLKSIFMREERKEESITQLNI